MDWKVTTEPTAEPVSLVEAKLHARIDTSADDVLVPQLITTARRWCELFQNRAYVCQTITAKQDAFEDVMELPMPPLVSVSSIKYIDTAGDQQTLDTSYYDVDTTSEPGLITLAYGYTWPAVRNQHHAIEIIYVVGYACPFTAVVVTNLLTVSGRVYTDADIVRLSTTNNDLPDPLAAATAYHVRDVSGSTLKLATTAGGDAIDIIDTGEDTHFIGVVPGDFKSAMKLLITHFYEHRESVSEIKLNETPMAVKDLLWMERIVPI